MDEPSNPFRFMANNRTLQKHLMTSLLIIIMAWLSLATAALGDLGSENNPLLYDVPEENDAGYIVGNIAGDSGLDAKYPAQVLRILEFSFLQNPLIDGKQRFSLNSRTGIIQTTDRIDRDKMCFTEERCNVQLSVAVGPAQYFQVISVSVEIQDQNDNYPEFPVDKIDLNIPENTRVGAEFDLPSAEDIDTGMFGIQRYALADRSAHFDLREVTAAFDESIELKLVLIKELDREKRGNYRLVIYAYDGATPPLTGELIVNITVTDSNDNAPSFTNESYQITVPEDFRVNETLVTVTANDQDIGSNGRVVYSFNSRTQRKYGDIFLVRPRSGDIVLRRPLDYKIESSYHLIVVASDQGVQPKSDLCTVQIDVQDVNNHYPEIIVNTLHASDTNDVQIAENVPKGTFVAHIFVTDADFGDNGLVECAVDSVEFGLEVISDTQYQLVTKIVLDREVRDAYPIVMTCTDSGDPPLRKVKDITVYILDVNDFTPEFTQPYYIANIKENNVPGTHVVDVTAVDHDIGQNANLTYYIDDRWVSHFRIHPRTGKITATASLDHEIDQQVDMTVAVRDGGHPPLSTSITVLVTVQDLNDEPPIFSQKAYSFGIFENERPDIVVNTVYASDKDSDPFDRIVFEIVSEDVPGMFTVTPEGEVRVTQSLDREKHPSYNIQVAARNTEPPYLSSTVDVQIYVADKNDHSPVMIFPNDINDTVWISNKIPKGYVVTRVRATDEDMSSNARLVFKILGTVDTTWFHIDSQSGEITTLKNMDNFVDEEFELDIQVTDQGEPPYSTNTVLYIRVNSSIPFYLPEAYYDDGYFLGLDPNTVAVIVVGAVGGVVFVILLITVLVVKRQKSSRRSHTYKCRPSESQRMLKTVPADARDAQDAWKERPVDDTPEILYKVPDTKAGANDYEEYHHHHVTTPTAVVGPVGGGGAAQQGKSPNHSPLHQIKKRSDMGVGDTYQDRSYDCAPPVNGGVAVLPPGAANTSTYRPLHHAPPGGPSGGGAGDHHHHHSDLYQPLVHGDSRVAQPCDPAVEELRLLEYLKHISDDEYGESEGESNPDSGRGASEEGDHGANTDAGKNGAAPRRSPSKCGSEPLKTRPPVSNVSTFMSSPHSPKSSNGGSAPAPRLGGHSSIGTPPIIASPTGGPTPTQVVPPTIPNGGTSNAGINNNAGGGPITKIKKKPTCPRPPSSTYQSLKDMAMYVDDDCEDIDADLPVIPPPNTSTPNPAASTPNSMVGVRVGVDPVRDLCYTDNLDVKHSIV